MTSPALPPSSSTSKSIHHILLASTTYLQNILAHIPCLNTTSTHYNSATQQPPSTWRTKNASGPPTGSERRPKKLRNIPPIRLRMLASGTRIMGLNTSLETVRGYGREKIHGAKLEGDRLRELVRMQQTALGVWLIEGIFNVTRDDA